MTRPRTIRDVAGTPSVRALLCDPGGVWGGVCLSGCLQDELCCSPYTGRHPVTSLPVLYSRSALPGGLVLSISSSSEDNQRSMPLINCLLVKLKIFSTWTLERTFKARCYFSLWCFLLLSKWTNPDLKGREGGIASALRGSWCSWATAECSIRKSFKS